MKTIDVCALGELLIDFTQSGKSAQGNDLFEANPGGASCNVLAMLKKLGHSATFLGKVSNDMFGRMLRERVGALGIDIGGLRTDREVPTTLAFVRSLPGGDRDFSFYRCPGADAMLCADKVDVQRLGKARIFHFGALSLTHEDVRAATRFAVETASADSALISFDPNICPSLWKDVDLYRAQALYGLERCDIAKIADNEIL